MIRPRALQLDRHLGRRWLAVHLFTPGVLTVLLVDIVMVVTGSAGWSYGLAVMLLVGMSTQLALAVLAYVVRCCGGRDFGTRDRLRDRNPLPDTTDVEARSGSRSDRSQERVRRSLGPSTGGRTVTIRRAPEGARRRRAAWPRG